MIKDDMYFHIMLHLKVMHLVFFEHYTFIAHTSCAVFSIYCYRYH